jgi:Chaperone of endosialidase/Regulator of chromosome condensation (RCC1) repeat
MKTKLTRFPALKLAVAAMLVTFNAQLSTSFAQGTAFTYQGRLVSGGQAANGIYDLEFTVYRSDGSVVAGPITNSATGVTNGLFCVTLDFGTGVFDGGYARWLEIGVRTNGATDFDTLSPRQSITPAPYAIHAATAASATTAASASSVAAANITGTMTLAQLPPVLVTNNQAGVNLTGVFTGNGAGITNVPVDSLSLAGLPVISAVIGWGNNDYGEATPPAGLTNVTEVAVGWDFSLALKSDGTVVGWGDDFAGDIEVPAGLNDVVSVAAGGMHSLALKQNGTVVAWGDDSYGETDVPAGLTNVIAVAAGGGHCLALKSDGTVVAWGLGTNNLGYDDDYGQAIVPTGLTNVVAVSAGFEHSLALKRDGTVVAWGEWTHGATNVPAGLTNVIAISAGWYHNLALKRDGTVAGWGIYNSLEDIPAGLSNVVALSDGPSHGLVLKNDGTVVVWGDDTLGQTNVPAGLDHVLALAQGGLGSHVLVIQRQTLSALALTGQANTFNGINTFNGAIQVNGTASAAAFSGDGGGLTNLDSANLVGTIPVEKLPGIVVTNTETGVTLSGAFAGNGAGLTSLDAAHLTDGLTIQPDTSGQGAPDIIAGSSANFVLSGVVGATIAGGGATNDQYGDSMPNSVSVDFGTIGGGELNTIQADAIYSTIGGGQQNDILPYAGNSTIGGGGLNSIGGGGATISGGNENRVEDALDSTIAGGVQNRIQDYTPFSTIGGGEFNMIQPYANDSTIAGGNANTIQPNANASTIAGGSTNTIETYAYYSTIGGGYNNTIQSSAWGSAIGGGYENTIQTNAYTSTIAGGLENTIQTNAWGSTIAGGAGNTIQPNALVSTIGGGSGNTIQPNAGDSTIAGGLANTIQTNAWGSTIGGGDGNTIQPNARDSTIAGGYDNVAAGQYSFAAGENAKATHDHSFVWGDGSRSSLSQGTNTFNVLCTGGFWIFSGPYPDGVKLPANGTAWVTLSDRNAKKNFRPVDCQAVLNKLATVPVERWNYKWEKDTDTPNIGPMAQDFIHAFYPGRDDKGISTLEFDGVELAAIQGLNQKLNEKDATIQEQGAEIQDLKARLEKLEQLLHVAATPSSPTFSQTGGGQ